MPTPPLDIFLLDAPGDELLTARLATELRRSGLVAATVYDLSEPSDYRSKLESAALRARALVFLVSSGWPSGTEPLEVRIVREAASASGHDPLLLSLMVDDVDASRHLPISLTDLDSAKLDSENLPPAVVWLGGLIPPQLRGGDILAGRFVLRKSAKPPLWHAWDRTSELDVMLSTGRRVEEPTRLQAGMWWDKGWLVSEVSVAEPETSLQHTDSYPRGGVGRLRRGSLSPAEPADTANALDALTRWPGIAVGFAGGGLAMAALSLGGPYARLIGGVGLLGAALYAGWRGRWVAAPRKVSELPDGGHEADVEAEAPIPSVDAAGFTLGRQLWTDGTVRWHAATQLSNGRPCIVARAPATDAFRQTLRRHMALLAHIDAQRVILPSAWGEWSAGGLAAILPTGGGRLSQQLEETGPAAITRALEIGQAVALGLAKLHDGGWVHRQIAPVLLAVGTGRPPALPLIDPLSAFHGPTDAPSSAFVGQMGYAAPEQFDGTDGLDMRADIYGLGASLYHLLMGMPPFAGSDTAESLALRRSPPEPFARRRPAHDIHPAIEAVVRQSLADDPARRQQTALALHDQLDASLALDRGVAYADVAHRLPPLLDMRPIPAGEFWMGSDDYAPHESPRHRVRVSAFHMSATAVTQSIYAAVMGQHPARFAGPHRPIEQVSWLDAVEFCNRLSAMDRRTPAYDIDGEAVRWRPEADGYRLPTEAEWEYACRAGTETRWSTGDDEAGLTEAAWYVANAGGQTHPVAQKAANAWGLYDMHGNVWEWTADWYEGDVYRHRADKIVIDPTNANRAAVRGARVLRGGSFDDRAVVLRSAVRNRDSPSVRFRNVGFRCVWGARQQRPSLVAP